MLATTLESHSIYNLVRFYTNDIQSVATLGVDIVKVKRGISVEAVVPEYKMTLLEGLNYEVVIRDMEEYYSRKMSGKVGFGDFYTYDEAYAIIDSITALYPDLVKERWEIGEGWLGNKIYALKISDNPDVEENEPKVLYDACIHAREPVTVNVLVETIKRILEGYDNDPECNFLIDNRQLYFIPILNPDGYLYNESNNPGGGGMWRKNMRDEGDSGVDLNRNFPYMWGYDNIGSSPYVWDETYRGPFPASEPETQAYIQFVNSNNFVANLSYHSYAGILLHPWGYNNSLPPDYTSSYEPFAIFLTEDNNYPYGTPGDLLYNVNGCSIDWFYWDKSCYSFSPEVDGDDFWDEASIPRNLSECVPMNIKLALASGPYLAFKEHFIDDIEFGNGDGALDTAETVEVSITIKNVGIFDQIQRVSGVLFTRDAYIELQDAYATFGYIPEQCEATSIEPYRLYCHADCPQGHVVDFSLRLIGSNYLSWAKFNDIVGEPVHFFVDDFENGSSDWLFDYPWAITSSQSHSPYNSATDSPTGDYGNMWDRSMTMVGGADLSCASYGELSFYHKYSLETGYDYGYCEVSIDDGMSWAIIGSYTGHQSDWLKECISLDDYCGDDNLKVRFRINTDTYVTDDGWYIDDVVITGYPVYNHLPTSPIPLCPIDGDTVSPIILVVENATDLDGDQLTYGFKVYADPLLTNLLFDTSGIDEGADTTVCILHLPSGSYYWRAYAEDSLERGLCCLPSNFHVIETGMFEGVESSIYRVYPNPAKGMVNIHYQTSGKSMSLAVDIYNIAGQLVRKIHGEGNLLLWDGMDDKGRKVPNGMYYLESREGIRLKIIYMR